MLTKGRIESVSIDLFSDVCGRLNIHGQLEANQRGEKFLVMVAPHGGRRVIEIDMEFFQALTQGLPRREAIDELTSELMNEFTLGSYFLNTDIKDMDRVDNDFFMAVDREILELTIATNR